MRRVICKPGAIHFLCFILACLLFCANFEFSLAQSEDIEFSVDLSAAVIPLPKVFKPNIDLSGRGFSRELSWPQGLAAQEVLDSWQKEVGFSGVYRMQYNLWEINDLAKNRQLQDKLLANHEDIIKKISGAGGVVILNIFGTPAGLGKVLDKKSPPWDMRAFKELIKGYIRLLSCIKKYNIWYEVWSAPDLDDFFLGRKQEYLNLYRVVAETVKELEKEYKIHIPLGGPSVSWWFQNLDGNNIITPEKSLIYELIRFCSHYRLPLDFISWHTYTSDPQVDKELTSYGKTSIALIRDWLSYFNLAKNTPLIVDEWNYDSGANFLSARHTRGNIAASYYLSRIKNMYEAGLDYQVHFCLEDFQNNKEGVVRNLGVFWFDPESPNKGGPKSIYNIFKIMSNLGDNFFPLAKTNNEFTGSIVTKSADSFTILLYNYIDPGIANNYLSRNIASLSVAERRSLLSLVSSERLYSILRREIDPASLRITGKLKSLLKKAVELNDKATKFSTSSRIVNLTLKNLKADYLYQRYVIDASLGLGAEFSPMEQKEVLAGAPYKETLTLSPYSIQVILLKLKPKVPEPVITSEPQVVNATVQINNTTLMAPVSNATIETARPQEAQNLSGLPDKK
ncbi:MAG: hypothetical protein FJZ08_00790 [Candidatus Omnitrophica bacterium]|nr:hypothetical protein [Candidatus Omnitrophota bacterium]